MSTTPWPRETATLLLPQRLFSLAETHAHATYAEFPIDPCNIGAGYRKITYAQVANAVHAMAFWLEGRVGKPKKGNGEETLVYMGPNDIRYAILCLGAVVVGYKMLFPSPRYSVEAVARLVSVVDAKVMLTPEIPFPVVTEVLARKEMVVWQVPGVEDLLYRETGKFPYTKTFEECSSEPLVCLHTSGTTGFPKPIVWTHDWVKSVAEGMYLSPPPGYEKTDLMLYGSEAGGGARELFLFPPFHASGVIGMVLLPLIWRTTPIYPPQYTTPATAVEGILDALDILAEDEEKREYAVNVAAMIPPMVEYLGARPDLLARLRKNCPALMWGGGSVSRETGAVVAAKMTARTMLASTEMAGWPSIHRPNAYMQDCGWEYMTFHPALNIRFDPVSVSMDEGTVFEAIMMRNDGVEFDGYIQPPFKIFTDAQERSLGDLFVQHPRNAKLWKHYGRADDLLVFLTNEKFNPGAAERRIASHLTIAEVLMVGTRRSKASLIIRLEEGVKGIDDEIWELIEDVNKDSPVYARVQREMILVVDEPFIKTAKGSVQRRAMLDLYEKELDELYGR